MTSEHAKRALCKSCGAEVIWARTEGGKNMPLNAKPEKRFVLTGRASESASYVETFQSHFSTCPNADAHRKKSAP